jgi:cellulose synthase/poly-beta-1,6-N-acetylglucosamine synthase-like glycosyltransferase
MIVVLVLALVILGYIYGGYPALLRLVVRVRGPRPVRQAPIMPPMTLVISAYNEAEVIARKLENALSLTYPREALEIVVVSDASDDGTDEIVAQFASRGVRLVRQSGRFGKTAGLNRTVPALSGEIVVFSDANAIYERDALLKLARNFADSRVGCVTGEARYVAGDSSAADAGERAYWDYEIQIKRLETALGSMVGGDGAIYAIRRSLWRELPENAINDFLNPLQIVEAGWRAVYEPEAVCYEETAGGIRREYRRRVRIVSRSWRAVFQARGVLNPLRVGLFTWCLVSHKMLRWLSGVFAAAAAVSGIAVIARLVTTNSSVALGIIAATAAGLAATRSGRRMSALVAYFATIYAASAVGVWKGSLGHVSGVWAPPRQHDAAAAVAALVAVLGAIVLYVTVPVHQFAAVVFWSCTAVLGYVYAGYPALLATLQHFSRRAVRRAPIEPRVSVLIAANDEEAVIEAKLQNTLALDYPADRLEIVVASDGSVDATNGIVRRFAPRVRLLDFAPRRGKIATINDAMSVITSEVVVFSDANTFLAPDAVRALVRNFADPQVGAVSGDVVLVGDRAALGPSEDLYYRYERWVQRAESQIGSMIGADGALYAIRRELFVPPPADTILDDMAIPMAIVKAGRRVIFEPAARALEKGSETASEEFARKARVIAGAMQFLGRRDSAISIATPQVIFSFVSHKVLRWLSPAFAGCAVVSSLVLVDSGPAYTTAVAAQATLVALGLAGCVPALRRRGPVAIAHYFCLIQAAAAVGFVRGLARRQSVLWRRFERAQSPLTNGVRL